MKAKAYELSLRDTRERARTRVAAMKNSGKRVAMTRSQVPDLFTNTAGYFYSLAWAKK